MTASGPQAASMSTSDARAPRLGAEAAPGTPWAAVACLVALGLLAYAGSTRGPFVYLDQAAIRDNPTIRHLWPLARVLTPPVDRGVTVEGRPLVNWDEVNLRFTQLSDSVQKGWHKLTSH